MAAVVLLCAVVAALFTSVQNEKQPAAVSFGTVTVPDGTWSWNTQENEMCYTCPIPSTDGKAEQLLFLRSNWKQYQVQVDGQTLYAVSGGQNGAFHLIPLPVAGKTLVIRFSYHNPAAVVSIKQVRAVIGEKGAMFYAIARDSAYAVSFFMLALVLSLICVVTGCYMRSVKSMDTCHILTALGLYILCAGFWVLTDSEILLLITPRSGVLELMSFLAFFTMPMPLLSFTGQILSEHQKTFAVLKKVSLVLLLCYVAQYLCGAAMAYLVLAAEHVFMGVSISLTLYFGFREMKRIKSRKLHRMMVGYAIFAAFSMLALAAFYTSGAMAYSTSYILGVLGFVLALADTAWITACEQIQENANVAMYARMAYKDMMTGLENRAAFHRDVLEDVSFGGAIAYVMMDANNLKKINDTMGHHRGDELILQIAACLKRALGQDGNGYRLGGDEFVARLKNVSQKETEAFVEALQQEIAAADAASELPLSAAIGYAWTNDSPKNPEKLLHQADSAMYEQKKRMKNK